MAMRSRGISTPRGFLGLEPFFLPSFFFIAYLQPSLSPAPTVDDINTSQRVIYDTLSGAQTGAQLRGQGNRVHVTVAAEGHVCATHAVAAGGHRQIRFLLLSRLYVVYFVSIFHTEAWRI